MPQASGETVRKVSVMAATIISLACGTNYCFSAWEPQLSDRLNLSSKQSNLIGVFGNLGMYASGIPVGLLVDSRGPLPGTIAGSLLLGGGYLGLNRAYEAGANAPGLFWLCLFSLLTGFGGSLGFAGSVKTSALNWPDHRGTATAFPLAAFGLSAFFFSSLSTFAFPNNTSDFLLMLSIGTFLMILLPGFFLRIVPNSPVYSSLSSESERRHPDSNPLIRTKSGDSKRGGRPRSPELGTQEESTSGSLHQTSPSQHALHSEASKRPEVETEDTTSLLSMSVSGDEEIDGLKTASTAHESHHIDVRGWALLTKLEFYQQFSLAGVLTGIGLMTINNIGEDARALWTHWDDSVTHDWIQQRQLTYVSIISVLSFIGRLLSGIGSDFLVKKLHMSRSWCLFISSCVFCIAQLSGITIENPNYLTILSGLTGLAYGFLFGVLPSIVAETFGVHGLSQNWGCMTIAPVIFGNIFNILYGSIYDQHSIINPEGHHSCPDGRYCYSTAYWITFGASLAAVGMSLWTIQCHHAVMAKIDKKERDDDSRED